MLTECSRSMKCIFYRPMEIYNEKSAYAKASADIKKYGGALLKTPPSNIPVLRVYVCKVNYTM